MTDLTPEARALLDLARGSDGATESDRERVRRGLAATLGAGAFATTTTTAAAKAAAGATAATAVTGTKFAAWVAVGLVTGLGGVAAVTSLSESPPPRPRAAAAVATAHSTVEATRKGEKTPSAIAAPVERSSGAAAAVSASPTDAARRTQGARRGVAREEAEGGSLLAETHLIERGQAALARGNPTQALSAVEEHRHRYPDGILVPERLAVQAVALCKLGDVENARRSAEELKRVAPASPLWPRVRQACSFE